MDRLRYSLCFAVTVQLIPTPTALFEQDVLAGVRYNNFEFSSREVVLRTCYYSFTVSLYCTMHWAYIRINKIEGVSA